MLRKIERTFGIAIKEAGPIASGAPQQGGEGYGATVGPDLHHENVARAPGSRLKCTRCWKEGVICLTGQVNVLIVVNSDREDIDTEGNPSCEQYRRTRGAELQQEPDARPGPSNNGGRGGGERAPLPGNVGVSVGIHSDNPRVA